jgi:resuscitation-promoting factor RpfB
VAPTTTAAPAPPVTHAPKVPDASADATWDQLARCETGGNWSANTGNGYYGGLQFSEATWHHLGGTGLPHEHSRATQIEMGKKLHAQRGWAPWPGCARKLGWV